MKNRFVLKPLDPNEHDRAAFNCGVDQLDKYIREQARNEQKRRIATVFVFQEPDSRTIVGYYTLSSTTIAPVALRESLVRKLPRYPSLPAALIGRLAVDIRFQGTGVGGLLLVDALKRALHLSQTELGLTAVVIDATNDNARDFYEYYGFERFADQEYKLYIPIETINKGFSDKS